VIAPTLAHTKESLQATMANNLWTTLWMCRAVYNAAKGGVHGADRADPAGAAA